jgi:hypothetical protein
MIRHAAKSLLTLFLFCQITLAQSFTMNPSFLTKMIELNTIQPTFSVRINAHGPLHSLATDCEMHVAGTPQNVSLGNPSAIIVEFPNWCEFNPQGNLGDSFNTLKTKWDTFATNNLDQKTCDVTGFLRIFTEHASSGGGATNPDHAYEYHPALSMKCGSNSFSFQDMLRASEGLRHISNGAASSCLSGRQLQVKFAHNRYEFFESGGGTCGNFVIVRVSSVNAAQSLTIDGGHYAVVKATANGQTTSGVGLYTLSGSPLDSWLANAISHGGIGSSTKVVHGVFTYNWQSIINSLKKPDGTLRRPTALTNIQPSLAIIAYGETTAPF